MQNNCSINTNDESSNTDDIMRDNLKIITRQKVHEDVSLTEENSDYETSSQLDKIRNENSPIIPIPSKKIFELPINIKDIRWKWRELLQNNKSRDKSLEHVLLWLPCSECIYKK